MEKYIRKMTPATDDYRPQIFLSQHKANKELARWVLDVFKGSGVFPVAMTERGYVNKQPSGNLLKPYAYYICEEIRASNAVFLLLGPKITHTYTKNWMAFELGCACALEKNVFIFKQNDCKIDFPIPYMTDYMNFEPNNKEHFRYTQKIIHAFKDMATDPRCRFPEAPLTLCKKCGATFYAHLSVLVDCPLCGVKGLLAKV